MAKQTGNIKITGTIANLRFYSLDGAYYVRMKSCLNRKRFFSDNVFEGSRKSAALLAQASPLASCLYKLLPPQQKGRPVYQKLTGEVKKLLQQGVHTSVIVEWFQSQYLFEED